MVYGLSGEYIEGLEEGFWDITEYNGRDCVGSKKKKAGQGQNP